jgi:hypothetical protein
MRFKDEQAFVRRNEKSSEVATACDVPGSYRRQYEDDSLLEYVSEESCKSRPTFQKRVLPP